MSWVGARGADQRRVRRTHLTAAAIAIALIGAATYVSFIRELPFTGSEYVLKGEFGTANQLRPGSQVRIGGLNVGSVTGVEPGPDGEGSVVSMRIDDQRVPVRTDADLEIRPRLPLEGNYVVRISPGSPGEPELASGAVVPRHQTKTPVQLDQLLGVFDLRTRGAARRVTKSFADALGTGGTGRAGGAEGLRDAARALDSALASVTRSAEAFRGERPGDLTRSVRWLGALSKGLSANPVSLGEVVDRLERVSAVFARHDRDLSATIEGFADLLADAPEDLDSIQAALPPTARLLVAARPALASAPQTLALANGALAEIDSLVDPWELPRLVDSLRPSSFELPRLNRRLSALFPLLVPAMRCVSRNIVPALSDRTLEDGRFTTGQPAYLELLHLATGLAGVAQGFDGNGTTLRLGLSEDQRALLASFPGIGDVVATGGLIQGVAPTWFGLDAKPDWRPDAPCTEQDLPELSLESRRHEGIPIGTKVIERRRDPVRERLRGLLLAGREGAALRLLMSLAREHLPAGRISARPKAKGGSKRSGSSLPDAGAPRGSERPRLPIPSAKDLLESVGKTGRQGRQEVETLLDDLRDRLGIGR